MLIAKKGNRELKIGDHQDKEYLAQGYDILDPKTYKVVQEAPNPLKSKVTSTQKAVINTLIGVEVGKELSSESLEKLAGVLGVVYESKAKSAESIQEAYTAAMTNIKL